MRDLTELCMMAKKHETDKGGRHLRYGGGDSDTCHEYTPVYHDLLAHKRDSVRSVLEIGINAGSSLRMWRDFFPKAMIYGLDCNPHTFFIEPRIECHLADQGSERSLLNAISDIGVYDWPDDKGFDLIVDDGSHELAHQILSQRVLVPFLSPDGVYVIEDMHDDCHPEIIGQHVPAGFTWRAYTCDMGIGKAHCWCSDCTKAGGTVQPEQLLIIARGHPFV